MYNLFINFHYKNNIVFEYKTKLQTFKCLLCKKKLYLFSTKYKVNKYNPTKL